MKKITKIICLMVAGIFVFVGTVLAGPINTNREGIAIKGYDAVAYFMVGKPVVGKKAFQHDWNSAKWYFSNEDHLELFKTNPEKYAPQYGGY
jgi:YHS domain-containing protein